jgi:hypothetical protein
MLENQTEGWLDGDTYLINSKTILEAVKNGDTNVFTLQTEMPEDEVKTALPVQWNQADFIKVFTTFQQTFLNTTAADQKIRSMNFELDDCKDINFGPQKARIYTYMLKSGIFVWPPFRVVSYSYSIDPSYNYIHWHGQSYDQYVLDALKQDAFLDLANIKISAEEALRIAELNGGRDARLAVDDQCSIDIELDANSNNGNWLVTYNSYRSIKLLRIEIDKTDGNSAILTTGEAGTYGFDSQTILGSLKSGNNDVFIQLSPSRLDGPILQPVDWTQADYYQVADAFMKTRWKEGLSQWNLDGLYFESNCDDASFGPQFITFFIFRKGVSDKYYYDARLDIKAEQNILTWTKMEDDNIPYLLEKERRKINWTQIKISADQALQIVEDKGGEKARLRIKQDSPDQNCHITSWLNRWATFGNSTEWDIGYWTSSKSTGYISAFINMETGEVRMFNFYENVP